MSGFFTRHAWRIAGLGALATVFGGVFVNAAFLQPERHPAPFFARNIKAPSPVLTAAVKRPVSRPVSRPSPASRQGDRDPVDRHHASSHRRSAPQRQANSQVPPDTRTQPARVRTASLPGTERVGAPSAARDLIGSLILNGHNVAPRPPRDIPERKAGRDIRSSSVAAAQKALVRIGFSLTIDGLPGPATRKAIEAFQKKNGLAVTGQLENRTARLLTSRSGVSIP